MENTFRTKDGKAYQVSLNPENHPHHYILRVDDSKGELMNDLDELIDNVTNLVEATYLVCILGPEIVVLPKSIIEKTVFSIIEIKSHTEE